LGALLLDHSVPSSDISNPDEEGDGVQEILDNSSVRYKHRNEAILRPSAIQDDSAEAGFKTGKKPRAKQKANQADDSKGKRKRKKADSPDPDWPPRRKHHPAPLSPQTRYACLESFKDSYTASRRLKQRAQTLLSSGYFKSHSEMANFVESKFATMTPEEKEEWLGAVDRQLSNVS